MPILQLRKMAAMLVFTIAFQASVGALGTTVLKPLTLEQFTLDASGDVSRVANAASTGDELSLLSVSENAHDQLFGPLGMFASGTKFMWSLLQKNLDHDYAKPRWTEKDTFAFWKHTHPYRVALALSQQAAADARSSCRQWSRSFDLDRHLVVATVRNPLAQIAAWKKTPYDLKACVSNPGEKNNWYRTSCSCFREVPAQCACCQSNDMCALNVTMWDDLPTVWNSYVRGYLESFTNVHIVRYEDAVQHTERTMHELAEWSGLPLAEELWRGDGAEKERARRTIQHKTYLYAFTPEDVRWICSRLNSTLMRLFKYDDCDT